LTVLYIGVVRSKPEHASVAWNFLRTFAAEKAERS
jgi:hypothetical protein